MTAFQSAREHYLDGKGDTFYSDLAAHYEYGHVIEEPDCFFMWRTVPLDWPLEKMLDPHQSDPRGICAFLWMVQGNWRKAAQKALSITPWVRFAAYERRGVPKLLEIQRVLDNSD